MVIVACLALNIFHPAFCFKEGVTGLGGVGSKRQARKREKLANKEASVAVDSGSGSDAEKMHT